MQTFETDVPCWNKGSDNLIFPFGPPIFQTHIPDDIHFKLLSEAQKLNKEDDNWNPKLAGQLYTGRSYQYKRETRDEVEPYLRAQLESFANIYIDNQPDKARADFSKVIQIPQREDKTKDGFLELNSLWVNFQKKNDYNPLHTHEGKFSFVIYLKVPENIFKTNTDSNTKNAGKISFVYGQGTSDFDRTHYIVTPYDKLMFIFPVSLHHEVAPFWVDETRISVSGNFQLVPNDI